MREDLPKRRGASLPAALQKVFVAAVFRCVLSIGGLLLFGLMAHVLPDDTNRVIVRLEDTGEALINPGMGWTIHFYSNYIENYGST